MVRFVVLGSGIAGVCCATELIRISRIKNENIEVIIVSAVKMARVPVHVVQNTVHLVSFDVETMSLEEFTRGCGVQMIQAEVSGIDVAMKFVHTSSGDIYYDKLCVCTGASPKVFSDSRAIYTIRDHESILRLAPKLNSKLPIVLIGNGAIALEFIYAMMEYNLKAQVATNVIWIFKDSYIGHSWLDRTASAFLLPRLYPKEDPKLPNQDKYSSIKPDYNSIFNNDSNSKTLSGSSMGPFWYQLLNKNATSYKSNSINVMPIPIPYSNSPVETSSIDTNSWLTIYNESTIQKVEDLEEGFRVFISQELSFQIQFIVSAIGVTPNTIFCPEIFCKDVYDAISVNHKMETSVKDVFAAGDCCSVNTFESEHWFQMRLWTQARLQGLYVASCMLSYECPAPFDLFTHVTTFFGLRVVLLGRFNGQEFRSEELETRLKINSELYVKLLLRNGKLIGAVIIGESELEEVCENLILNELNINEIDILSDEFDSDYFD